VPSSGTYYGRVRARNLAGVYGSNSGTALTIVDMQPPMIKYTSPSGNLVSTEVTLLAMTDERAVCFYSLNSQPYVSFGFTNNTFHETIFSTMAGSGSFRIKCRDALYNENVSSSISFTVVPAYTADQITLPTARAFTDSLVSFGVVVNSQGQGLSGYKKDDFTFELDNSGYPFSVLDNGDGDYTFTILTPPINKTYVLSLSVAGITGTGSLVVEKLPFTIGYSSAVSSPVKSAKIVYYVPGNYTFGLATDSISVETVSSAAGLNLTSDANTGDSFIFVSKQNADAGKVESLLKAKTFLDAVNPSFGYGFSTDYLIYANLEYDDIALVGSGVLEKGRHTLIIRNAGFDSSLNKTRLEVRVQ
jgi:hypothetical protein